MRQCDMCTRVLDTDRELEIHKKYYHAETGSAVTWNISLCPDCGSQVAVQEGCRTCLLCGWSRCT